MASSPTMSQCNRWTLVLVLASLALHAMLALWTSPSSSAATSAAGLLGQEHEVHCPPLNISAIDCASTVSTLISSPEPQPSPGAKPGPTDWRARFIVGGETPQTEAERFFVDQPAPAQGSSVRFNSSGANWAIMNNVCWRGGGQLEFVRRKGAPPVLPSDWRARRPELYNGFGWAWGMNDVEVRDPEAYMRASDVVWVARNATVGPLAGDGTWISMAPFVNHLYHFLEGHMGYRNLRMHPESYPPVKLGIAGNFGGEKSKNILDMWDFIQGPLMTVAVPPQAGPPPRLQPWLGDASADFHRQVMPPGKFRVCFQRLYGLGRRMMPEMGGLFSSAADADAFRVAAIAHWKPRILPPPQRALRAFVALRTKSSSKGRVIRNPDAIMRVLNRLGINAKYLDHSDLGYFERVDLKTTVEWMINADIFIGAHGNGCANAMFMPRGGGLVELYPPHFRVHIFDTMAVSAGLEYTMMASAEPRKPIEGCGSKDKTNWAHVHEECLEKTRDYDITVNEDDLEVELRQLALRIAARKYGTNPDRAVALAIPRYGLSGDRKTRQTLVACCDEPEPELTGPMA